MSHTIEASCQCTWCLAKPKLESFKEQLAALPALKDPTISELETTADQSLKKDAGKAPLGLLPSQPLTEIAKVLAFGAKKYEPHGWRKGMDWSRLYDAALRHLLAFKEGEDRDPESGELHLAHLGCCVLFLLEHQTKNLGKDDRYKP
jgi:hypothetical protein